MFIGCPSGIGELHGGALHEASAHVSLPSILCMRKLFSGLPCSTSFIAGNSLDATPMIWAKMASMSAWVGVSAAGGPRYTFPAEPDTVP